MEALLYEKTIILLVVLMLTAFALAETNQWSLEGTFVDVNENYLGIIASDDPAEPGWYIWLSRPRRSVRYNRP